MKLIDCWKPLIIIVLFYVIENKFGPLSERLVTDLANTEWITIKESYFLLTLLPGVIYSRYFWNRGGWLNSQLNCNKNIAPQFSILKLFIVEWNRKWHLNTHFKHNSCKKKFHHKKENKSTQTPTLVGC